MFLNIRFGIENSVSVILTEAYKVLFIFMIIKLTVGRDFGSRAFTLCVGRVLCVKLQLVTNVGSLSKQLVKFDC